MSAAEALRRVLRLLTGRTLALAVERNRRAAEGLDAAVREMLGR